MELADGAVVVPLPRGFEVSETSADGGARESVTLRRPSRVRGAFEECTILAATLAPEPSAGADASRLASIAAAERHEALRMAGGLPYLAISAEQQPTVITWTFAIHHALRARERYWGHARAGRSIVVRQTCQTVGTVSDLLVLETLTAPRLPEM